MEGGDTSASRKPNYERLAASVEEGRESATELTYTVGDAIAEIGVGRFQYGLLALTGLCWTAESMEMLLLSFIKAPLQCAWGISDASAALITTSVGIGMLTGATSWGLIGDRYGRRVGFIASTIVTFVFGIVSALSVNYPMMVLSRGAVGFGIGGVPVSFSLMMEFLPTENRGTWGMAIATFWALGAIFESLVAMLVVPTLGWRWLIAISSLPLLLVLLASYWLTESPCWLISKGHVDRAQSAVEYVSRTNRKPLPPGRLAITPRTPEEEMRQASRFGQIGELLRRGARLLAVKIWFIWFVSAFVYYGLVTLQPELIVNENIGKRCSYAERECAAMSSEAACGVDNTCLWKPGEGASGLCGLSELRMEKSDASAACRSQLTKSDFVSTLWASVGELPGLILAFVLIDIIGRRPLLGYMFGGTSVAFVLLLGCIGRLAESVVFFCARGLSSGSFQAIYIFTNELYPSVVRTTAMGLSSSMARVGLIVTPFVSQYLANANHAAAMWIYFAVSGLAVLGVFLIPIETTGRPMLSSMDELIATLRLGETTEDEAPGSLTFAKDPSVPWIVRFFRWRARVDGGCTLEG